MPRPRKSLEQHIADGTYRKDRHATWGNLRALPAPLGICPWCGTLSDAFASSADELHYACPSCIAGAVVVLETAGYRVVPDQVLRSYGVVEPSSADAGDVDA